MFHNYVQLPEGTSHDMIHDAWHDIIAQISACYMIFYHKFYVSVAWELRNPVPAIDSHDLENPLLTSLKNCRSKAPFSSGISNEINLSMGDNEINLSMGDTSR